MAFMNFIAPAFIGSLLGTKKGSVTMRSMWFIVLIILLILIIILFFSMGSDLISMIIENPVTGRG